MSSYAAPALGSSAAPMTSPLGSVAMPSAGTPLLSYRSAQREVSREYAPVMPPFDTASILSRMSGPMPVPASKFRADKADMMDMVMSWNLIALDAASLSALWIRRLDIGRYEVDGRRITLQWCSPKSTDIIVREDDVPGQRAVPLADYLRQAAATAKRQAPCGQYAMPTSQLQATALAPREAPLSKPEAPPVPILPGTMRSVFSELDSSDRIIAMCHACRGANHDLKFTV